MSNVKSCVENLPNTFQKIVVHTLSNEFDKATKIQVVEFSNLLNELKPHQVIVRYTYLGINASDINYTAGRYDPTVKPPFDCGFEGIGEVVVIGSKTNVKLLQPVAVMNFGTFAEFQILNQQVLIPIPELNPKFLALLVSGLTAALALKYHGHMKAKEVVMITAAAGGAGQMAVQLAKLAGNHVIGTCSSGKESHLKAIGCDRVINYKAEDVDQVLKTEYPDGIDIVFESVGGTMFNTCIKRMRTRGRMIVVGAMSNYASKNASGTAVNKFNGWNQVDTSTLLAKSTTITGFFLNHYVKEFPKTLEFLIEAVMNGNLTPQIKSFQGV